MLKVVRQVVVEALLPKVAKVVVRQGAILVGDLVVGATILLVVVGCDTLVGNHMVVVDHCPRMVGVMARARLGVGSLVAAVPTLPTSQG